MFDISFTEILVVCVASLSVLGVQESINVLKAIKKFAMNVRASFNEYLSFLDDSTAKEPEVGDNILDEIVDLDGNLQKRYDLSKIIPKIQKQKK